LSAAGFDSRDAFRGFGTGVGVGCGGGGSALERMLEKAIGSAGLLGVCGACALDLLLSRVEETRTDGGGAGSCLTTGPPIATPFCRPTGDEIGGRLGDCEMEDGRGGWACEMGERGGKVELTGEVYEPL
jgi:hypothetical protein